MSNNQNNSIQNRIQNNRKAYREVIMARGNNIGHVAYNPMAPNGQREVAPIVNAVKEGIDNSTASIMYFGMELSKILGTLAAGQKCDIYAPTDTVIRVRSMFARLKNNEELSLSDEEADAIVQFHGDNAESYAKACDAVYGLLQKAKAEGKYVQVHMLDDILFTRLPESVAKNWKLSGLTVKFSNGSATIAKGTKLKDSSEVKADIKIDGVYAAGTRQLSVRTIGGNREHKELVALKDATYSYDLQILQGMRLQLLAAMPVETSSFATAYREAQAARQSA